MFHLDAVVSIDSLGVVNGWNAAAESMFGFAAAQTLGQPLVELIIPSRYQQAYLDGLDHLRRTGESVVLGRRLELEGRRADGEEVPIELTVVSGDDGDYCAFIRDLSRQYHLVQDRLLLAAIVESSDDAILTKDRDGVIRTWNDGAEQLYGYEAAEAVGQPMTMLLPPDRVGDEEAVFQQVLAGGHVRYFDTVHLAKDGTPIEVSMSLSPLHDPGGAVVGASTIARDVTDRRRAQAEIAHRATHDDVTGLANRAAFMDYLATLMDASADLPVAVLLVDLDRFKVVNDSLGHERGDDLLAETGQRLASALGPLGLVARFGSDQFGVAVAHSDLDGNDGTAGWTNRVVELADLFHKILRRPFSISQQEVYTTASIGIATRFDTASRHTDLVRHADSALQIAKDRGRDRTEVFDDDLRESLHRRLRLRTELHEALQAGQFHLYYQPEISLATGRIVGVEALLRWVHPLRGVITAGEFIVAAEEEGLTVPLAAHVLHEGTQQLRQWAAAFGDRAPFVAINYSARQLNHPSTIADIAAALETMEVSPRLLVVELTETTLMDDADWSLERLAALKDLGVGLAVDDFGTGYSSLNYLKRFPVDTLKIDRSFVDGVCDDPHDSAIVAAIINMARALDLTTTAEGIETSDQLDMLRRLGCDVGQGFFLARPQPAPAITELLSRS